MKNDNQDRRGFLVSFFATLMLAGLLMTTINVVIDPFWRFDLVSIQGINAYRPVFSSYSRMAKAGVMCRMRPKQVAFGTSRAEVGIDPSYPAWNTVQGPVYNFALAGLALKELSMMFTDAVNVSPDLKRATIGLDFLMFNANREAVVFGTEVLGFDPARLLQSRFDTCVGSLWHDVNEYLGIDGLYFSYKTIVEQPKDRDDTSDFPSVTKWLALYNKLGFRDQFDVLDKYIPSRGARATFGDEQEFTYVDRIWRAGPDRRYCFTRPGQPDTMKVFRDLVDTIYRSGVNVRLYMEPLHSRMMLALQDAGLWLQFEDWKRAVITINEEEAGKFGKPPMPLFDFSGFNSITNVSIPQAEDRTHVVKWFWEPSHYKKATGDLILSRVLDDVSPERPAPNYFGVRLSENNIDDWLIQTRIAGQKYRSSEPQEAALVKAAVDRAMERQDGANCGAYMPPLIDASDALKHGDRAAAEMAIASAVAVDRTDRTRAEQEGVAYREPAFATSLQNVRAGRRIEPNLNDWIAYQARGQKRAAEGDNLGAADDLASAIRLLGAPNPALYFLRGNALMAIANYTDALTMFEIGLSQDPNNETLKVLIQRAKASLAVQQTLGAMVESW